MNNSAPSSSDNNVSRGLSRRAVSSAAVWTVPAVAVAAGAPLAAASPATAGSISIASAVTSALPGSKLPWTVTATSTSGTIDSPLSFTLTLPAGLSFADGSGVKTITVAASNQTSATVQLVGPLQVFVDADALAGQTFTPTASNWTANWPVVQVPTVTVVHVAIPAGGTGAVWGTNYNSTGWQNFNRVGTPNNWATPLNNIVPLPVGTLLSLTHVSRALAVVATGSGTTVYCTDDAYYTNPNQYGTTVVPIPALRSGEYVIDLGGFITGITNQGRLMQLMDGDQTIPTFYDATYAPHGAYITAATRDFSSGYALTYALDSSSKVWVWDGVVSNIANTPMLVIDDNTGLPLTDIIEVSGAETVSTALSATGVVYELYRPNSSSFAARQVATNAVKLGKSSTNARSYIGTDGFLYSWGSGVTNRHSSSNSADVAAPTRNPQADAAIALAGATRVIDAVFIYGEANPDGGTSAVILDDNSVWAWGSDHNGQLGNGVASGTQSSPVRVRAGLNSDTGNLAATRFTYPYVSLGAFTA